MRLASLVLATTLLATAADAGQSRIVSNRDWSGSISYSYDASGNVTTIGTDTFRYDGAGRLVAATINGIQQTFEYDVHGNRTKCKQGTSAADCQQAVIGDYNRISNASYDNAGNLQQWNGSTYAYDALGMVNATEAETPAAKEYLYTADDERIGAYRVGAWWQWTVRGLDGKVLREFTSNGGTLSTSVWTWSRDNIWRDGLLLASKQKPAAEVTTYQYHLDHLGTPRLVTTPSGTPVGAHDYFAFGAETPGGTTEPQPSALRFTGHEREDVGGAPVDYMHARYYSPVAGRFLSVDPGRDWDPKQPQSWNMYAYVRNNPINATDPTGRWIELSKNNSAAAREFLVRTVMRPTGRALIQSIGQSTTFGVSVADHRINPPAHIARGQMPPGQKLVGGTFTPNWTHDSTGNLTGVTGGAILIDTAAVARMHPDQTGVTTTAHEFLHATGAQQGLTPAQLKAQDTTGSANAFGQSVSQEKADISRKEAEAFVDDLLSGDYKPPEKKE